MDTLLLQLANAKYCWAAGIITNAEYDFVVARLLRGN